LPRGGEAEAAATRLRVHRRRIARDHDLVRTERERRVGIGRRREREVAGGHRARHGRMANAADPDDADGHARATVGATTRTP